MDTYFVLAIETSCDETSVAILKNSNTINERIVSLIIRSQAKEHEAYGGVVPELAARAHLENIEIILNEALLKANISLKDISAIAVTAGPGLIGGVLVGVMLAKSLSASLNIPLYAINHLEGHALTPRLTHNIAYPYLLLLTSGGHCMFVEVLEYGDYTIVGETLDDAAGECFDKVAKLLGLDFPGGPALEQKALHGDCKRFVFPKPLHGSNQPNFSFSGLKTAVKNCIEKQDLNDQTIADIAASFQYTVGEIFKDRFNKALEMSGHKIERFVMAGGVAANKYLRTEMELVCLNNRIDIILPPMNLCTDNAAMIGWAAIEGLRSLKLSPADLNFQPLPRWLLHKKLAQ
jgi:N6-L-threonylcarbamoyladenine synthase